jgi:hypothetical protein
MARICVPMTMALPVETKLGEVRPSSRRLGAASDGFVATTAEGSRRRRARKSGAAAAVTVPLGQRGITTAP